MKIAYFSFKSRSILYLFKGFIGILLYKANKVSEIRVFAHETALRPPENVTWRPVWLMANDDSKKYQPASETIQVIERAFLKFAWKFKLNTSLVIDFILYYAKTLRLLFFFASIFAFAFLYRAEKRSLWEGSACYTKFGLSIWVMDEYK